jgi:hypothetical protein
MAVRRLRPRWTARRGDIQPDRHCQIEQRRPAGLVGRCPGPDRRSPRPQYRPAIAVELAAALGTAKSGSLIVGGDRIRLHDRLRRQPARRGRRLAARAVDRHVPRRRLPLGLRGRRRWCDCLHPVRHRVPEANHRRRKSRRQRTVARQADGIACPAVLTAYLRICYGRRWRRSSTSVIRWCGWRARSIGGFSTAGLPACVRQVRASRRCRRAWWRGCSS